MCVYLRTIFQVPSIILTSFRQRVILPSPPLPPTSKRIPKEPTQIRVKSKKLSISISKNNGSRDCLSYILNGITSCQMPRKSWRVYFYQNLENLEAEHVVEIQEYRQNNIENTALEN